MFKNFALAIAGLVFVVGSAQADDDMLSQLSNLDVSAINDAAAEVATLDLDELDMDGIDEANEGDEDAIAACFRRIGYSSYGHYGYGYRSYSYGHYYRPYRTVHYYRPVVRCYPVTYATTYHAPVYNSYWGFH